MAEIKSKKGIEARSGQIRITFHLADGTRRREPLNIPDTPKNLIYAAKLRAEILDKIRHDVFDYAAYFPDSPYVKQQITSEQTTVEKAAEEWLTIRAREIAPTTLQEYRNALRRHLLAELGTNACSALTYKQIKLHIAALDLTPKTFNNVIGPIKGVLQYMKKAKYITEDLASDIVCVRNTSDAEPDPLELDEIEAVLTYMAKHYPEQVHNYFEFAIFAGPRPSEIISLRWGDIDLRTGLSRIQRALVRGKEKPTKTYKARDTELHDRALAALTRQKAHTFMANAEVFHNPITGRAYYDTDVQVRVYWRPALKALGIRDRDARQTRHTCATLMLMAGCNPAWAAKQMGHSTEMFYRVYSKWIDGADKGQERSKFSAYTAPSPRKMKAGKP